MSTILSLQSPDVKTSVDQALNGARSVVINIKINKYMIIKRHGKIVMEEVGQKTNYLPALGIILFIAGTLLVGSLDYKVLVM